MPYLICFKCKTSFHAMNDGKEIPKEKHLCDECFNESKGFARSQF